MQIHDLIQGTPEWDEFRLNHYGASEAAAMLGLSKKVTRSELLVMKHTGNSKEFSIWVRANILDHGHEVEALARPIFEKKIDAELYPVTCSNTLMPAWASCEMSASCDGLTIGEDIAFEHKQWNTDLAASVAAGTVPEEHMPQCQQVLMVTGAKKLYFVVSDGTAENMVSAEVTPDPEWFKRILAGWEQFDKDLAEYVHQAVEPVAIGRTPENLPALHIVVSGEVSASNLTDYKAHALEVFGSINRDLQTDQHFADAAKAITWCESVEDKLEAAKQHALSQTQSIDELFSTINAIKEEARRTRLELSKLVEARKVSIRSEIQKGGVDDLEKHIKELNARIGKEYMPTIPADFAGAMKGKKTVTSLRDAVSTTLANAKIKANEIAANIEFNMTTLSELAADHLFLFADVAQLVLKSKEDFSAQIRLRIADHKASEAAKTTETVAEVEVEVHVPTKTTATVTSFGGYTRTSPKGIAIPDVAPDRPTDAEIVQAIAEHFDAQESDVLTWLRSMNFEAVTTELAIAV